jgi:hypothetical protein
VGADAVLVIDAVEVGIGAGGTLPVGAVHAVTSRPTAAAPNRESQVGGRAVRLLGDPDGLPESAVRARRLVSGGRMVVLSAAQEVCTALGSVQSGAVTRLTGYTQMTTG